MRQRVRGSFLWTETSTLRAASLCAEEDWWTLAEATVAKPARATTRVERMLEWDGVAGTQINEGGVRPRRSGRERRALK